MRNRGLQGAAKQHMGCDEVGEGWGRGGRVAAVEWQRGGGGTTERRRVIGGAPEGARGVAVGRQRGRKVTDGHVCLVGS